MNKLSKADSEKITSLHTDMLTAKEAFDKAVSTFNEEATAAFEKVKAAEADLNATIAAYNEKREEIKAEIEEYVEDRTERWKESERALAYEDWIQEWDNEVEETDIDSPEEFEADMDIPEALPSFEPAA